MFNIRDVSDVDGDCASRLNCKCRQDLRLTLAFLSVSGDFREKGKLEFLFLMREDLVRTRPSLVDLPQHNSNPEVEKQRVNVFDNVIYLQASG